ncbi:MAG: diguanylate cyclase [Alkalibacterium sp.]|nr:diguanylate cyclase [Alkalibacterium sp.]
MNRTEKQMVADLFVNICIVVSMIFLYMKLRWKSVYEEAYSVKGVLIDGCSGGLMGFILMYFSIQVTEETLLDLRYVPIMLLVLFIGKTPALLGSVLIIISRFFIGVNRSAMYAVAMISILFVGYSILEKLLRNRTDLKTKALYMTLFSNAVVTYFLVILVGEFRVVGPTFVLYWIISSIAGIAAVFLVDYIKKSEYLFSQYETESSRDFLTGLYNVRRFDEVWERSAETIRKNQGALTLLMLDIDHFKTINDTHGHAVGDLILIELSRLMEKSMADEGTVFRKGGEEFAIILPRCDKSKALKLAEKLRFSIEYHDFVISEEDYLKVTVSIGVASYPETTNEIKTMIDKADMALYLSKSLGRNQVSI